MISYSQIIKFTRVTHFVTGGPDTVIADRISKCMGYTTRVEVDFTQLYRGHAQWVADQINHNQNHRKR